MQRTMKSLVLVEPEKLVLEERPVPSPGAGEVLIRVRAAAICHTDFFVISGEYRGCKYPTVLGHEFSGIVEQCGENVIHVKPGDLVACLGYAYCGACPPCRRGIHTACRSIRSIPFKMDGAFQEMICVPALMAYPYDSSLDFAEAALAEPAANGYAASDRADIYPGERVVVIGPGPIGLLAMQAARFKSPGSLIMLGTRPERLRLAAQLGATYTVNVRETNPHTAVMHITEGYGADVVLLCAGEQDAWNLAGNILADHGRVVVEALPPVYNVRWPVPVFDFTAKTISYLGIGGYTGGQFAIVLEMLKSRKINLSGIITHIFALEDYQEAFETSEKRTGGAIKVIFEI